MPGHPERVGGRRRAAYGAAGKQKRPRGKAPELHSRHLLSGLIRCGICGARITIQASQRKKNGRVYRYGRYRCSFHMTKGSSVCWNSMSIRQQDLETKLVGKFRDALTPEMIDYLVTATNQTLSVLHGATPHEVEILAEERRHIEGELSNLVAFVAKGDVSSPRLREEIGIREQRLAELGLQLERLRGAATPAPLQINRTWVQEQVLQLNELLSKNPAGARREIQKHIEDLRIAPAPEMGERVIQVTGRAKVDGLLRGEEAVRLQLVAGAGFEPATFGLRLVLARRHPTILIQARLVLDARL